MIENVLRRVSHDDSFASLDLMLVGFLVELKLTESLVKVLFVGQSPVEVETIVSMRLDIHDSKDRVREHINLLVFDSGLNSNWQSLSTSHIFVVVNRVRQKGGKRRQFEVCRLRGHLLQI